MITTNSNGQSLTASYATTLTSENRDFISRLTINGTELNGATESWTVTKGSCGGADFGVGSVMSCRFEAKMLSLSTAVKGEDIKVEIGLKVNGSYVYITLGYFTVTEVKKNHYSTNITAYGHSVSKTGSILSMSNTQTLNNIKNAISSATGVNVTMDNSIDGTEEITQPLTGMTVYQVLQILASVVGGYVMDVNDGSIAIHRFGTTSSLSVDTSRMINLPDVEETNYTITGVECVVDDDTTYTSSGTVNLSVDNPYMTQSLFTNEFAPALIGYSYRPASIDLTMGDPRLEGNDVVTVTDIDNSIYTVPCHTVRHTYNGGLSTTIDSIRATTEADSEATPAPISTQIKEQEKQITRVDKIASNTNQYFWFNGTGSDTGAHITEVPQDEWNDSTSANYHSGGNLLARSNGIAVRDGMAELATFGATGATIGKTTATHADISASGMQIYASDGVTQIANLGYGTGNAQSGTATAPFYTLGTRALSQSVGNYSVAEGVNTVASAYASHAEGYQTVASNADAHAEGDRTIASGQNSHAEGSAVLGTDNNPIYTVASGFTSHAEGAATTASGNFSHSQNLGTIAASASQTALGKYNEEDDNDTYAVIVGNGASNRRSNALTIDWSGTVTSGNIYAGDVYAGDIETTGGLSVDGSIVASDVDISGDINIGGDITIADHSTSIGSVVENYLSSDSSLTSGTAKAVLSVSLSKGLWLVNAGVRFSSNSSGYRRANVSPDSASTNYQIQIAPSLSGVTQLTFARIIEVTANSQTFYLNAMQNGGALSAVATNDSQTGTYIYAVRLL